MKKLATIVTLAACAMLCACQNEKCKDGKCDTKDAKASVAAAGTTAVGNKVCPIGGHGAEKMVMVAYKGKSIGFCCQDCVQSFNAMSEADKDKTLAKAEANAKTGAKM